MKQSDHERVETLDLILAFSPEEKERAAVQTLREVPRSLQSRSVWTARVFSTAFGPRCTQQAGLAAE
ncbi:MAG: hypothetical protein DME26_12865 [Verrucomicrobia bacterium]|nr:MAG: hypothetical protein DME26_12865 [Verrucomicrobiota bacterium]